MAFKKINITEKTKKNIQIGLRIFLIVIISIIFGMSIYTWNAKSLRGDLLPMPFGIGVGVVLTGSMEPDISGNDMIIVRKTNDYAIEDVVVYQSKGNLVVHKIISIDGDMITTKGTANNTPDDPINVDQIKGEVVKVIPKVGLTVKFLKSPTGTLLVLAFAALLLVLSYKKEEEDDSKKINSIKEEIRKIKEEIKK